MNAGFSNLHDLKAQLLAATLRTRTDWDAQIRALGLGVAATIAAHCNRTFARAVGAIYTTSGGRQNVIVPCYPVEAISSIETATGGVWSAETGSLAHTVAAAGLVYFSSVLSADQIRVTYTGGYFWNTKEPTEAGYPTTLPGGATALPDDVLTAWHLQCEALWRAKDKLGTGLAKDPDSAGGAAALTNIELIPAVKAMLAAHVRYALT